MALYGPKKPPLPVSPPGQWREDAGGTCTVVAQFDHVVAGRVDRTAYVVKSGRVKAAGWCYAGGGPGALRPWDSLPRFSH